MLNMIYPNPVIINAWPDSTSKLINFHYHVAGNTLAGSW